MGTGFVMLWPSSMPIDVYSAGAWDSKTGQLDVG
jgi:hypothetical protein